MVDLKLIIGIVVVVLLAIVIFVAMRKKASAEADGSEVSVDPMAPYGVTADDGLGPKPEDAIVAFISNTFLAATGDTIKVERDDIILKTYDFGETPDGEFTCDFQIRGIKSAEGVSSFTIYGSQDLKIATLIKVRDETTYRALSNVMTPQAKALFSQEFTE